MKKLMSIFVLFSCIICGSILREFIDLPIPDVIYGMLILFILMFTKVVKVDDIENVSNSLLENLAFLFLPLGVSLMTQLDILEKNFIAILTIVVISCFLTMLVTSKVVELVQKLGGKK